MLVDSMQHSEKDTLSIFIAILGGMGIMIPWEPRGMTSGNV